MAITRQQKEEQLAVLKERFAAATSAVLADFTGLKAGEVDDLRSKFRAEGIICAVVKNTLAKRAIEGTEMASITDDFVGPTAVAFGGEDPATPARVLRDFVKTNDRLTIRSACVDGTRIEGDQIKALADMPTKDELRAIVLGLFDAPARELVGVMAGPTRELVGVFKAYEDKLGEG